MAMLCCNYQSSEQTNKIIYSELFTFLYTVNNELSFVLSIDNYNKSIAIIQLKDASKRR